MMSVSDAKETGPMSCYRFILTERDHYPVRILCQTLGVPAPATLPDSVAALERAHADQALTHPIGTSGG